MHELWNITIPMKYWTCIEHDEKNKKKRKHSCTIYNINIHFIGIEYKEIVLNDHCILILKVEKPKLLKISTVWDLIELRTCFK